MREDYLARQYSSILEANTESDEEQEDLPLYAQLAEQFREQIQTEAWKPSEQIPTEEQLCESFNVSRTTVRRALEILVQEKLLERRRPKGTFVRPMEDRDHTLKTFHRGFTEELVEQGKNPQTLFAKVELSHASVEVARQLKIKPGEQVLFVQRLRGAGQKAFVYFQTWLTYQEQLPLRGEEYYQSLYALLRSKGIHMRKRFEEFEAILPDEHIQDVLGIKRNTAVLKRTIGAAAVNQEFYEYTVCFYIGSEYLYRFDYS